MSNFLDKVKDQVGPPADQPAITESLVLKEHEERRMALMSNKKKLMVNASPKFSSGPNSTISSFPTQTDNTRESP